MLRYVLCLLSAFAIVTTASVPAFAQAARGIVVTPKRVVFGDHKIVEVLIANRGTSEQKFRISIVNRAMQPNGQLIEIETPAENEFFAKDVLRYTPRQITLGPKETQKVRIMSRLGSDAADGEYRSHLLIQEIPEAKPAENAGAQGDGNLGVNVQAIFGVTIPVILRRGDLSAEVKLSTPKFVDVGGERHLQVTVNRSGTKSFLGTANVFADGQKVGTLKNVAVYMSTLSRVISIRLDAERAKQLSGKDIRVTFGAEEKNEDAPSAELSFKAP